MTEKSWQLLLGQRSSQHGAGEERERGIFLPSRNNTRQETSRLTRNWNTGKLERTTEITFVCGFTTLLGAHPSFCDAKHTIWIRQASWINWPHCQLVSWFLTSGENSLLNWQYRYILKSLMWHQLDSKVKNTLENSELQDSLIMVFDDRVRQNSISSQYLTPTPPPLSLPHFLVSFSFSSSPPYLFLH